MCGIAGILSMGPPIPEQIDFPKMSRALSRRGPDDEGIVVLESEGDMAIPCYGFDTPLDVRRANLPYSPKKPFHKSLINKARLIMLHRRLSILDLGTAGHQPMSDEEGRFWITYNGEIYNYKEIRRKLESLGEVFHSNTDTEVILKSYKHNGVKCLNDFNGMWAFAIWDNKTKNLFCARDRIGIKPFYYIHTPSFFIFASDIKTLIASGVYKPEPNWEGVYHALSLYCAPRPITCFDKVHALEPGHWLIIRNDKVLLKRRYWQLPVGNVDHSKPEREWIDETHALIKDAINLRLVADVPVGVFMSGGIDSTTCAAISSLFQPGINAFTIGRNENDPEVVNAKRTASKYNITHYVDFFDLKDVLKNLKDIIACYEEPFPTLGPTFFVSRLAKENRTKVVLNGLGPDELFAGYGRERLLRIKQFRKIINPILELLPANPRLKRVGRIINSIDLVDYYLNFFSPFSEHEKKELFNSQFIRDWNTYDFFRRNYCPEMAAFSSPLELLTYLDIVNYISNHHVFRTDQFTMHFSIEARLPFLDYRLVELSRHIPASLMVRNRKRKYILRKIAREYIHKNSLELQKKGFSLPMAQWMRGELKDFINDMLSALKKRDIFNRAKI